MLMLVQMKRYGFNSTPTSPLSSARRSLKNGTIETSTPGASGRKRLIPTFNKRGYLDDEEYIVRLIGRVVNVSVETVKLVDELAQAVKMDDWLPESVEAEETTT